MTSNYDFDGTIESYFNDCFNNPDDSEGNATAELYKHYIEYCSKNKETLLKTQKLFVNFITENFEKNIRSNKTRVNNTYLLTDTNKTLPTTPINK
jgi:hypothetical protein